MSELKIDIPKLRDYGERLDEEETLARRINAALYSCKYAAEDPAALLVLRTLIDKTDHLIRYYSGMRRATEDICDSAANVSRKFSEEAEEFHYRAITQTLQLL